QPPLTGRERSGSLRQPRRIEKARFATPFQRHDRQGKVHARRAPCPISLKYEEETSPHPHRTLRLLSRPQSPGAIPFARKYPAFPRKGRLDQKPRSDAGGSVAMRPTLLKS